MCRIAANDFPENVAGCALIHREVKKTFLIGRKKQQETFLIRCLEALSLIKNANHKFNLETTFRPISI